MTDKIAVGNYDYSIRENEWTKLTTEDVLDEMGQAAFVAKFWDGKFPVVIYDIAQNAYQAGFKAAIEKAAEVADAHVEYGGNRASYVADAIRKIEVEK